MHVRGVERLSWVEQRKRGNHRDHANFRRQNVFLEQTVVLCNRTGVYQPGDYAYAFEYRLHETLPASYRLADRVAGQMRSVCVETRYTITVSLPVEGAFVSDLETTQDLVVTQQPVARPTRSLSDATEESVRFFCCFKRGICRLSAAIDQDVLISGSTVRVDCSAHNESTIQLHTLSLRLYQQLVVKPDAYNTVRAAPVRICKQSLAGASPGERTECCFSLDLLDCSSHRPILPTTTSMFANWEYYLEVKCEYMLCPGICLEFPVVILPYPDQLIDPEAGVDVPMAAPVIGGDQASEVTALLAKC